MAAPHSAPCTTDTTEIELDTTNGAIKPQVLERRMLPLAVYLNVQPVLMLLLLVSQLDILHSDFAKAKNRILHGH